MEAFEGPQVTAGDDRMHVVIVHYGPPEATRQAVLSVRPAGWPVTVVDNDGRLDLSGDGEHVRVLAPGTNLGFGRAVNLAARDIDTRWLMLLNPDADASPRNFSRL